MADNRSEKNSFNTGFTYQMVRKKRAGVKKAKKSSAKKVKRLSIKSHIAKSLYGVVFLAFIVVVGGFAANYVLPPQNRIQPISSGQQSKKTVRHLAKKVETHSGKNTPSFEIFPEKENNVSGAGHSPAVYKMKELLVMEKLPKVAIIIDDLGYDRQIAEKFLGLDAALTFSILPHSPFQDAIARKANEKGLEIMLHLPMEPMEYPKINPGPGALYTTMSNDSRIYQLKKNLDAIPFIKGVNNHMGSRMTSISTQMYQIFSVLKKKDLYFIDSRTTEESLCKPSARLLKIPFAQRDVFLDHHQTYNSISNQIRRLIHIANIQNEAIGIGHPHEITCEVLRDILPDIKKQVEIVPASEVTHIIGL